MDTQKRPWRWWQAAHSSVLVDFGSSETPFGNPPSKLSTTLEMSSVHRLQCCQCKLSQYLFDVTTWPPRIVDIMFLRASKVRRVSRLRCCCHPLQPDHEVGLLAWIQGLKQIFQGFSKAMEHQSQIFGRARLKASKNPFRPCLACDSSPIALDRLV